MESPYDSDVSEDTRDLILRGLATDTRNYSRRADLGSSERASTFNRNMNTLYVHPPLAHVVQAEEPSARGLDITCGENVKDQKHNNMLLFYMLIIFQTRKLSTLKNTYANA